MSHNLQMYFTTGEFAKLCNVSKHTLFHYDHVGIFSPAIKEENGYRYYGVAQIEVFYVISILKELDMPLQEIKNYLDRRSPQELVYLLEQKENELKDKILILTQMQKLIHQKKLITESAAQAFTDAITVEKKEKEYFVITEILPLVNDKQTAILIAEHVQYCQDHGIYSPHSIGGMISLEEVKAGNIENYKYFYTQIEKPLQNVSIWEKEAGLYLTACHKGGYETVLETYQKLIQYAEEQSLIITPYFYEDVLLDELSVKGYENYILKISIKIKDEEAVSPCCKNK